MLVYQIQLGSLGCFKEPTIKKTLALVQTSILYEDKLL